MAIMETSKRMVFWKILVYNWDWTTVLSPYISSMSIKHNTIPSASEKRGEEEKDFPYEATIEIISKNYVENVFIEGCPIKIYIGYNRILTEKDLVFDGTMINYPDGEAREMLKYTIKAYGYGEPEMLLAERNRTFSGMTKPAIVRLIMSKYKYNLNIYIDDINPIKGKYSPGQSMESDYVKLQKMAQDWGCLMWFRFPNEFYFTDAAIAHTFQPEYNLGYRTDKTKCNVETVTWKHNPNRAAEEYNPGVKGLGENGDMTDPDIFKINAYGQTWVLKDKFAKNIDKKNPLYGEYAKAYWIASSKMTLSWQGKVALMTYYRPMPDDPTRGQRAPDHADSGWEITVKLNEGNPSLRVPINAKLYYGSVNPRADSSMLPFYIHYYSGALYPYIRLKVNETKLTYANGKLDSELICTIGRFV